MHLFYNIPEEIKSLDDLEDHIISERLKDVIEFCKEVEPDPELVIHLKEVLKYFSPFSSYEEIDNL